MVSVKKKKKSCRLITRETNLARKYLRKKIPALKKISVVLEKILHRCKSGKKNFYLKRFGKKLLQSFFNPTQR